MFVAGAVPLAVRAASKKIDEAAGPRFFVAALTALDERRNFDPARAKDYLTYLAANGVEGALVLGTTGEFASFSVKERKQILEGCLKHRGKLAVMAQVGAPNVPETLDLLAHAAGAGADSVLVLPPFYYKNVSLEGLVRFYEPILNAARVPVLLYNIPQTSGVAITPDLLRRLAGHANLYGIKDSFSKPDAMIAFIREFPKLHIMTGVPGNIAANLQAGGAGAITGNGSVFARETASIFQAFRTGGDVAAAQARFNERARAISGYDGIPAQKYALTRAGLAEMYCRPPFVELTPEQKKQLSEKL
jgi:4-hydroxy-tetrahydrodipicolinate synthase